MRFDTLFISLKNEREKKMFKNFLAAIILLITFPGFNSAQDINSLQVNGGIIMPMSSSKGLTASVQFNYSFNPQIQFYSYIGYAAWDLYKVIYRADWSENQRKQYFEAYPESDHTLIPFYIGSKINFHSNKLLTAFVSFEAGYSHISYHKYDIMKIINPETGEVVDYLADGATKEKISENLFGIGAGVGISHPVTRKLNLLFSFKLNTFLNSDYSGALGTKSTYTIFLIGFNYNI